jgi:hypothetical protein
VHSGTWTCDLQLSFLRAQFLTHKRKMVISLGLNIMYMYSQSLFLPISSFLCTKMLCSSNLTFFLLKRLLST